MDTKEVAEVLGTEPRLLRRFLRDPKSTFEAVGSGARYEFTETDLPELERRFNEWAGDRQANRPAVAPIRMTEQDAAQAQRERDMAVWAEEGPVFLEDIRDPRVRRRVQETAREWDNRLTSLLLASGQHISQRIHKADAA